jgi:hypothetical protein
MKRTADNLKAADSALEEIVKVKPENEEKKAIKTFCNEEVQRRLKNQQVEAELSALRIVQKELKSKLIKQKCVMLSKEDHDKYQKMCASQGISTMPPYLRKVKTNKDASITPEVIQEAIDALTPQDLEESKTSMASAKDLIKEVILTSIRRIIRSYTETTKLMLNMPRGQTVYDLDVATSEIAEAMYQSWKTDHEIKVLLASKKVDPDLNKAHNALKERVESYFIRAGITAQRIVVDSKPYKLVRRVSVRKSKVGIGHVEKMLDEVLKDVKSDSFKPNEVIRGLQVLLTSMPPETKSSIKLSAVKDTDSEEK